MCRFLIKFKILREIDRKFMKWKLNFVDLCIKKDELCIAWTVGYREPKSFTEVPYTT